MAAATRSGRATRKREPLQDRTNQLSNPAKRSDGKPHIKRSAVAKPRREPDARQDESIEPAQQAKSPRPAFAKHPASRRAGEAVKEAGVRHDSPDARKLRRTSKSDKQRQSQHVRDSGYANSAEEASLTADYGISNEGEEVDELDSTEEASDSNMFSFTGTVLQATPLAVQLSSHALRSFKRRPRQPSMLAMVQQRMADPTASRMGSVPPTPSVGRYDFDEIEDDFLPDAAGTPARISRGGSKPANRQAFDSIMTQTSDKDSTVHQARNSTRQTPKQSNTRAGCSSRNVEDTSMGSPQHVTDGLTDGVISNADFVTAFDVLQDAGQEAALDLPTLPAQLIAASPEDSSVLADPSSQQESSPERGREKRRRLVKVPSTADLQSLLPRRRRGFSRDVSAARVNFDASPCTSSPEVAEQPSPRKIAKLVAGTRRIRTRQGSDLLGNTGPRSAQPMNTVETTPDQGKRSYMRRAKQRTDNIAEQAEQRSASTTRSQNVSANRDSNPVDALETAKRKFAEIDQWSLDFETVTPGDNTSSQDYR